MAKKNKKRGGTIRFSRESMYNAGMEYCDTTIYTVKAPRKARRKLGKASRPCQEALNERNAKMRLKRLIEANFTEGKDIFVTFTFDKGHKPETRAEARKLFTNFLRRLRRAWKAKGIAGEPRGIYVLEGKDGGHIHIHVVMSAGMDYETVKELWGMALFVNFKILQGVEGGFDPLSKYLNKQGKLAEGERRWYRFGELAEPSCEELNAKIPLDDVAELGEYIRDEMYAGEDVIPTSERFAPVEDRYPGYFCAKAEAKFLEEFCEWVIHVQLYRQDTPAGVEEADRRRKEENKISERKRMEAKLGL